MKQRLSLLMCQVNLTETQTSLYAHTEPKPCTIYKTSLYAHTEPKTMHNLHHHNVILEKSITVLVCNTVLTSGLEQQKHRKTN